MAPNYDYQTSNINDICKNLYQNATPFFLTGYHCKPPTITYSPIKNLTAKILNLADYDIFYQVVLNPNGILKSTMSVPLTKMQKARFKFKNKIVEVELSLSVETVTHLEKDSFGRIEFWPLQF